MSYSFLLITKTYLFSLYDMHTLNLAEYLATTFSLLTKIENHVPVVIYKL